MPAKFFEITDDPYTNNTNEFVLILSIQGYDIPTPTAPGTSNTTFGVLADPNGIKIGYMWIAFYQDYEVTGTLSDEAYSHSYVHDSSYLLVPPNYKFTNFSAAVALKGTLEELAPFMGGKR